MFKVIQFFKRSFCKHSALRYWGFEEVNIQGKKYKNHTSSCENCGMSFLVRERI